MGLDEFMEQLVKDWELEGSLATEVPGVYAIPLEEDLSVMIGTTPQGISLTATLCRCPEEKQEEFFQYLMLANLFEQGTEGAVLGLDGEGKWVVLSRLIDYEIDYEDFSNVIEDFMNMADMWREETAPFLGTKVE